MHVLVTTRATIFRVYLGSRLVEQIPLPDLRPLLIRNEKQQAALTYQSKIGLVGISTVVEPKYYTEQLTRKTRWRGKN